MSTETTYDTDRVLTVPNVLSFIRLIGIGVFGWLVIDGRMLAAAVLVAVSAATDWFDGFIARRFHQVSRIGQWLDPIVDRLFILSTIVGLAIAGVLPWWLLVVLLGRDVMLLCLLPFLRRFGVTSLPVNFVGKTATFLLMFSFPALLLGSLAASWSIGLQVIGWALAGWGAGLYWVAGLIYVRQTVELYRRPPAELLAEGV